MILLPAVQARLGPDAVRTGTAFVSFAGAPQVHQYPVVDRDRWVRVR